MNIVQINKVCSQADKSIPSLSYAQLTIMQVVFIIHKFNHNRYVVRDSTRQAMIREDLIQDLRKNYCGIILRWLRQVRASNEQKDVCLIGTFLVYLYHDTEIE